MQTKLRQIPYYASIALLVYMPFHIFLSQWLSTFTGGLDYWKGTKDVVTFALACISLVLVWLYVKQREQRLYWEFSLFSAFYFLVHITIYLFNQDTSLSIAALATAYNCRLFGYVIIGWSVALLNPGKLKPEKWVKLVLVVSTVVCLIGILQYVLPKDLMTHFGYSLERGVKPMFYINDDTAFPRIMSTLRDPNSLGAYLLVPIILLIQLISAKSKRTKLFGGLLAVHLLTLYLSFSRAAWGGLVIAVALLIYIKHKDKFLPILKRFWPVVVVIFLAVVFVGFAARDTRFVRSVVFRIDDKNPAYQLDSDELHAHFVQKGLQGVVEKPLGYGPGTAGIVSIQNKNGGNLTENYYLQIAHEVGVLGLGLFMILLGYMVWLLYGKKTLLSITLITCMGAYVIMALVMHLWSNEAVATQWWLLAGLVLGATNKKAKLGLTRRK